MIGQGGEHTHVNTCVIIGNISKRLSFHNATSAHSDMQFATQGENALVLIHSTSEGLSYAVGFTHFVSGALAKDTGCCKVGWGSDISLSAQLSHSVGLK